MLPPAWASSDISRVVPYVVNRTVAIAAVIRTVATTAVVVAFLVDTLRVRNRGVSVQNALQSAKR
jgi:hypothetical protein